MSRSRWVVILGPPLVLAVAAGAAVVAAAGRPARASAGAVPQVRQVVPCPGPLDGIGSAARSTAGTWWRTAPVLDARGILTGWRLTAAAGAAGRTLRVDLPPASSISGPNGGRVVVGADDGARSSLRIVDVAARCQRSIDLGDVVVRRAIADPRGGFIAHLVARGSRSDLGTWHVAVDGHRRPILDAPDAEALRAAGLERVWSTNLAASADGRWLAVQSCDPEACLTRRLERHSGRVTALAGPHGDLVGFAGDLLVTMAACHGLPCGVLAWSADGSETSLADATLGATISADGLVVVGLVGTTSGATSGAPALALAVDATTRGRRGMAELPKDALLLSPGSPFAGIEVGPHGVAVVDQSGLPSSVEVEP